MNSTRRTSLETYKKIKENGLLSKRRWQVYDILFQYGPITANELCRIALTKYPEANQTSFNARLSELSRMGVIYEVGEQTDRVRGNRSILWDVTDTMPKRNNASNGKAKRYGKTIKICESCNLWGEANSFWCGCLFPIIREAVIRNESNTQDALRRTLTNR